MRVHEDEIDTGARSLTAISALASVVTPWDSLRGPPRPQAIHINSESSGTQRRTKYGYDTDNLRVAMDDADGARRVLLDGLEEWGEIDEATGDLAARFDHDPTRIDALLAQATVADGHAAMLTDALGSVYGLIDDAATARARYGYDVYGARTVTLADGNTRWAFHGRARSGPALPVYYRQRLANPELGLWLSRDPAPSLFTGLAALADQRFRQTGAPGTSEFALLSNNPVVLLDPTGSSVHIYVVQPQFSIGHIERLVGHLAVAVIDPGRGLHDLVSFNGDFRTGPLASSDFSLSYSNPDDLPDYYAERGQDVVEYVYRLSPGEERRLALRIRTLAASSEEFLSCVEATRSVLVTTPAFRFLDNTFLRVLTFGPPGLGRALDWAEEVDALSWQESIFHEGL